jgi:hypothetical protein
LLERHRQLAGSKDQCDRGSGTGGTSCAIDLLVLGEGDRVAADAVLLRCTNLAAGESLLTGESVPVRKAARQTGDEPPRPGGDDLPYVYSGTLVTSGQGVARVVGTGIESEMGRIGSALWTLGTQRTRPEDETDRVVRLLALVALALCWVVVVGDALARCNVLEGLLAGLPWRCPSFQRYSRSCSRCSWRWVPGVSLADMCRLAASLPSKPSAQARCFA